MGLVLHLAPAPARGQTNFFLTNASPGATWSVASSWTNLPSGSSAPFPGGSNDYVITFTGANTSNYNDIAGLVLNQISFNPVSATSAIYGNGLIFVTNSGGGAPQIVMNSSAGGVNFKNQLVFSNDVVFGGAGSGSFTISGTVTGPGHITKEGPSLLYMGLGAVPVDNSATFSGGWTLAGGSVRIYVSPWAFGTNTAENTVVLTNGVIVELITSGSSFTALQASTISNAANPGGVANTIVFGNNVAGGRSLGISGTVALAENSYLALSLSNGWASTLGLASLVAPSAGSARIDVIGGSAFSNQVTIGSLSGAGTVVKGGVGVLELSGNNAGFSGAFIISNGLLRLKDPGSLGVGGGTLATVASGGGIDLATNFGLNTPFLSQAAGSVERWSVAGARGTNDYSVPEGMILQLADTWGNASAAGWKFQPSNVRTITNNTGSTIQGWISSQNSGSPTLAYTIGSNVVIYLAGDSFVGNSGVLDGLQTTNVFQGVFKGGGKLTKVGSDVTVLLGTNSNTGGLVASAGTLRLAGTNALGAGNLLVLAGGAAGATGALDQAFLNRVEGSSEGLLLLSPGAAAGALDFSAGTGAGLTNALLGVSGNAAYLGTFTPFGNTYRLGGGGGTLTWAPAIAGGSSLVVGPSSGGSGALVLSNDNPYSGPTLVNAGMTLQIGVGGTVGSIGTGAASNYGTISYNRTDGSAFLGGLYGGSTNASLVNATNGTVVWAMADGSNTFGTINNAVGGTLVLAAGAGSSNFLPNSGNANLRNSTSAGTLVLSGGYWSVSQLAQNGGTRMLGTNVVAGATFEVGAGRYVSSGTWQIQSGGVFRLTQTPNAAQGNPNLSVAEGATHFDSFTMTVASNALADIYGGQANNFGLSGSGVTNFSARLVLNGGSVLWGVSTNVIGSNRGISMAAGTNGLSLVQLNGGTFTLGGAFTAGGPLLNGSNVVAFNGGTLAAASSQPVFMPSSGILGLVQAGGGTIDDGGNSIGIYASLREDASSPGGGLVKTGSGTLTLAGTNSFTGGLIISAGTLVANTNGALGPGAILVQSGATLAIGSQAASFNGGFNGSQGDVVVSNGAFVGNAGVTIGSLAGATGRLSLVGGSLSSTSSVTIGSAAGSRGEVLVDNGATYVATNLAQTIGNSGYGLLSISNGATVRWGLPNTGGNNNIGNNGGSTGLVVVAGGSFYGGMGGGYVLVGGGGPTTSNAYGRILMTEGTLSLATLQAGNGFGSVGDILIYGGTASFNSASLGHLSSGSAGNVQVTNATLTTGGLNLGDANGATGTVFVGAGGVVNATSGSALGNAAGGYGVMTVSDGGVASYSGILGSTFSVGSSSLGFLNVSSGGLFQITSTGAFTIGGNAGGTGAVSIVGGAFTNQSGSFAIGSSGVGTLTVTNGSFASARSMALGSAAGSVGRLVIADSTVGLAGSVTAGLGSASISLFGNNQFNSLGNWTIQPGIVASNGTATFLPGNGVTNTLSGIVSGNAMIVQGGAGLLILSSNNSYTGGTEIDSGTLQVGAGAGSGWVPGDVVNHGILAFARSDTVTFSNAISGSGALLQKGAGTLVVASDNLAYSGGTYVSNGVLQVGAGGANGWVPGDIANAGTLVFNRADAVTFSNRIVGGALIQAGSGTFTLTGAATNSVLTNSAGTFVVDGGGVLYVTNLLEVAAGNLVIRNGTLNDVSPQGVALRAGLVAPGTITVADPNALVMVTNGTVRLGQNSVGTLVMSNGTLLVKTYELGTVAGGQGNLVLLGGTNIVTGTAYAGSGAYGVGNIVVAGGNTLLAVSNTLVVGNGQYSVGSLLVTGGNVQVVGALNAVSGSLTATGSVVIARTGADPVTFRAGGFTLGSGTNSYASMAVSNANFTSAGTAQIGASLGRGVLTMVGSTNTFTANVNVGGASGTGIVTATDGAWLIATNSANNNFNVGNGASGLGQVVVSNNSVLWSASIVTLGAVSNSRGSLVLDGSTAWVTNNSMVVASASNSAASLLISGGTANLYGLTLLATTATNATSAVRIGGGAQVNVGAGGIVTNQPLGGAASIWVADSTIGALASWSSPVSIQLTNGSGGGATTVVFAPTNAAHVITLSGVLGGNGRLVKDGAGALTLNTNNTYTGGTIISNGAIIVGAAANTAFGTGKVVVASSGVLAASNSSPDTLLGVVDATSSGAFALATSNTTSINFNSRNLSNLFYGAYGVTYTNGGVFTPYGTTYKLGGGGGALVYTNPIAGSSNLVVGAVGNTNAGKVVLHAVNTFSGSVTMQSGILQLNSNLAAGAASFLAAGGSLYLNTASQNVTNSLVLNSDLGMGAAASAGWIGPISGTGRLFLTNMGGGFLLSNNTYSGGTYLGGAAPTMYVQNANAFGVGTIIIGTNVASFTSTATGTLVLTNYVQIVGQTFASSAPHFSGVIDLMGQTNVALGYGGASGGTVINFLGAITNGYNVVLRNTGNSPGMGTALLGGSNAWSGLTIVQGNTASLSSNAGSIFGSTNFIVASGGTLRLDDSLSAFSRISTGAQVVLSNGTFQIVGPGVAGQIFTQQVGAVTVAAGANTLWTTNRATFAMADLLRAGGGTLNLVGTNSASVAIAVADAPDGASGGIIPWITVNGTDLAGWSGGQLGLYSDYLFNTTGFTVTNAPAGNWKLTNTVATAFAISEPTSVNSLLVASNAVTLNLSNSTLTVAAGTILQPVAGALVITNGAVDFGSAVGTLNVAGAVTNYASLGGAGGFAKSGAGSLRLLGTNTWQGDTTINQGSVFVGPGGSISNGGNLFVAGGASLVLTGGTVRVGGLSVASNSATIGTLFLHSGALTTTSNTTIQSAVAMGGVAGPITWNALGGLVSGMSGVTLNGSGATNATLVVAGADSVFTNVAGGLTLSLSNNRMVVSNGAKAFFPGATSLGGTGSSNAMLVADGALYRGEGNLSVGTGVGVSGNSLVVTGGSAVVLAGNNTVTLGGASSYSNSILVSGPGSILSNFNASVSGPMTLAGSNNVLTITDGGVVSISGATPSIKIGDAGSYQDQVIVSGSNSSFVLPSTGLMIGSGGFGNSMLVSNGGRVILVLSGVGMRIGDAATNSSVVVTGEGSTLSNSMGLVFGLATNSFGHTLAISDGGYAINGATVLGVSYGAGSNAITVAGTGSRWVSTANVVVGTSNAFNTVTLTNGGSWWGTAGTTILGSVASAASNAVLVAGPGATWTNSGAVTVGNAGSFNALVITNGGSAYNSAGGLTVGSALGATSNLLVVGTNSAWRSAAALTVGNSGSFNLLLVTNGGLVVSSAGNVGSAAGATNNLAIVTGSGTMWSNTSSSAFSVGGAAGAIGNALRILEGASLFTGGALNMNGSNGLVLVSGANSLLSLGANALVLGNVGGAAGNTVVITNGGRMLTGAGSTIGNGTGGNNNMVLVSGSGSVWSNSAGNIALTSGTGAATNGLNRLVINDGGQVYVGSGNLTAGSVNGTNDTIFITSRGLLDLGGSLISSAAAVGNWISNAGGVYQFTSATPTITPGAYGLISLNGGWISFRGVTNADVTGSLGGNQVGNILFSGNNAFRLNSASNWSANSQNYRFDAGISPSNYVGLEMVNGNTAWRSAWLAIGAGGTLLVSNTAADIHGVLTNSGSITVAAASASYWSNVVLSSGSLYRALAGTNAFNGGLVINDGATMTMDAWSTLTGTVTNNSLLQILTNAVYSVTGGQLPAGNGALNVSWGGALTYSNGAYAGFGGGGVTNDGVVDVQNLAVVTLGGSAGTPSGNGVLRVSGGGALNFGPGSYTVGNTVSNLGTVMVSNALVTFHAPVVIGGLYVSDPSTNVFTTNVTVDASGALVGSNGDLFVFQKDLYMFSTNRTGFNMWQAATLFTNGPSHFLSISNSGALKLGGGTNLAEFATNFAIGELGIALGDKLTLAGNKDTVTNALYVGWLNIYGLGSGTLLTNDYLAVSNTLVTVLDLDVNLYYDKFDPRNEWLNEFLPDLGYDLWGPDAGLLLPIPEPSPLLAVAGGLAVLAFLRRRRA